MVRTALSQVQRVHITLRSFLEPAVTSGFQGHYYFIPVCSIDTAVLMSLCTLPLTTVTKHSYLEIELKLLRCQFADLNFILQSSEVTVQTLSVPVVCPVAAGVWGS